MALRSNSVRLLKMTVLRWKLFSLTWQLERPPVVQKAKELGIPGLYFTNLISARPLMGVAGAGSLATVINAAIGNKDQNEPYEIFL